MKPLKQLMRFLLCIAVCLALAACNKTNSSKKISPEAAKQSRLDWNLKTTVGAYEEVGNNSPAWDEAATNALAEFAKSRSQSFAADEDWMTIIRTNCEAAVAAGCDDPMIRYLYIRFSMSQTNSPQDYAEALCGAALDIQKSLYPDIRKFYAVIRAVDQLFYAYGTNAYPMSVTRQIEPLMGQNLLSVIQDKTTPPEEAYEACDESLKEFNGEKDNYAKAYSMTEPPIFANWPDESTSWLLKGQANYQMAWNARGGGYADGVTADGWREFSNHLAVAESALDHAWKLNPKDARIPTLMIRVDEAQQKDRDDMELWFSRAMALNPNNYEACENKLHYLYPQWYGSRDDMVAFGKECAASTNWGGNVPLILSDAHREYWLYLNDADEKSNYWTQPDVWPDIKIAFDRFFELNPDAIGYYHNYAWFAYHCEQWDALNEIIPKLGLVNYSYFGGEDEFNKMVQLAKDHAAKPAAAPQQ